MKDNTNKNYTDDREKCWQRMLKLPPKWQQIFGWFIENFDNVVKMCEESKLTKQEVIWLRQKAIENDDAVLEFLMILKGVLDSKKGEPRGAVRRPPHHCRVRRLRRTGC